MSAQHTTREGLNFNTVLLTLVVGLSAWTLKEVVALSKSNAILSYRMDQIEQAFNREHLQGSGSATSRALSRLDSSSP
jgi:hypothetical protein